MTDEAENKLNDRIQKKVSIWWIDLLIGFAMLVVIGSIGYIFFSNQQIIGRQFKDLQVVQIALMAVCLIVTVIVGIAFSCFFKNQIRYKLELQAANEHLMASEQQARILATFPSENPNPVLRISIDNVVLYNNQAAEAILAAWGYRQNQYLCLPDRESKFMKIALSSGKPVTFDLRHCNHTFLVTLAPFPESGYVNIYAYDITDRKRAEEQLLDHQKKLKSLASQLSLIEERERHRLATDLHDQIGQSLILSKMKLDSLRELVNSGLSTEILDEVRNYLNNIIQDTRTLTFDLSSPILYELGFEKAVAEWLDEQIRKKHDIQTEFQDDGQIKLLDDDVSAILFRNVRELLMNIIKHAKASKVTVSVSKADEQICVIIEDDGVGFEPDKLALNTGFGIFSIRERLEQLAGCLDIESEPGRGTKITMTVQLKVEKKTEGVKV